MSLDLQLNKCCHLCEEIPTCHSEPQVYSLTPPLPPRGFFFHNINELIQSAKKGCHVCNLIHAELLESQIRDLQQELEHYPQHGTRQLRIGHYYYGDVALWHCFPGEHASELTIVIISIKDLHGR